MMENGCFSPAGLRVLVVDDDPTWLKILEKMLKKCSYEVTTCGLARDALNLLRERKDGYDIVISDVNMPDMDGFKLLEHVGLEMDLPVIMMSVDGETSRVMKGVQHGACDYLLKPIRMKELKNIWQHVVRKRIHDLKDIEGLEGIESIQMTRNGVDQLDDRHFLCGEDLTLVKKRKDVENRHDDKDLGDASSTKKARVVWSVDLHQKFVKAVNQIGFDKVGPKKILDLMNVPWLTRENVASHLQKYRLYLSRLQKENDLKTSVGLVKHSDSPSRDSAGTLGIQNTLNKHQNEGSSGNHPFSGSSLLVQNLESRSHETDRKGIVTMPVAELKRALTVDIPNPPKSRSSQLNFCHYLIPSETEAKFAAFDSSFKQQYSLSEIPENKLKEECSPLHSDDGFSQLQLPGQKQPIQAVYLHTAPSVHYAPLLSEQNIGGPLKDTPSYEDYTSNVNNVSSTEGVVSSSLVQTACFVANHQVVEAISANTVSMKNEGSDSSCITDLDSAQKHTNWGAPPIDTLDEDLKICWLQGDLHGKNFGVQDIEFPDYSDSGLIAEVPFYLYDAAKLEFEALYEPTEYSLIDQSLFIA